MRISHLVWALTFPAASLTTAADAPPPKKEPVSARLKKTLIHPNEESRLLSLQYSPDGKRLLAGDYPGGIIQVWDAESGKPLITLATGAGSRGSLPYIFVTLDWKTVYVPRRGPRKKVEFDKNGEKKERWEYNGDVSGWDLKTGELRETFKRNPPTAFIGMRLSPDGAVCLAAEQLPGEIGGPDPKWAASLWNVKTKQFRDLPHGISAYGAFSADSKLVALSAVEDGYTKALKVFDVRTAKEKLSIPIAEKAASAGITDFTKDGKLLIGHVRVYQGKKGETWQDQLKFWDAASGKELASFAPDKNSRFWHPVFSPNGTSFAAGNWQGSQGKLHLFDVAARKIIKTVVLTEKHEKSVWAHVSEPAYSPDGRLIAVSTQIKPMDDGMNPKAIHLPQPRIHLIGAVDGVVRETLIAPHGFADSLCFSPDGKTLASAGNGDVLLWDFTKPPVAPLPAKGSK